MWSSLFGCYKTLVALRVRDMLGPTSQHHAQTRVAAPAPLVKYSPRVTHSTSPTTPVQCFTGRSKSLLVQSLRGRRGVVYDEGSHTQRHAQLCLKTTRNYTSRHSHSPQDTRNYAGASLTSPFIEVSPSPASARACGCQRVDTRCQRVCVCLVFASGPRVCVRECACGSATAGRRGGVAEVIGVACV